MARFGMAVDLERCVGCQACAVACAVENDAPEGFARRRVGEAAAGDLEDLRLQFLHTQCYHCANPPCIPACPTGATYINRDGVCLVDYNICIGCRACVSACPYGMRYQHPRGFVDKCSLCDHRIYKGRQPACVETCPTQALVFGDLDDPESPSSKAVAAAGKVERDRPETGARPKFFFLNLNGRLSPMSWGAWILFVVFVTSALAAALAAHAEIEAGRWKAAARWRGTAGRLARWAGPRGRALAWINLGLGVALGLYTGILLSTMVARPALNSPLLAPLFLVSGMSAAAALLLLLAPGGPWGRWLGRVEIPLYATKFVLLALYIIGLATSTAAGQAAAASLVRGAWAWAFWPLVVAAGMVVPLGLALAEAVTHRAIRSAAAVSGARALAGGLALRVVLVYAGQMGL